MGRDFGHGITPRASLAPFVEWLGDGVVPGPLSGMPTNWTEEGKRTPSGRIIPADIFRLTALRVIASVLAVASGIAFERGFG